MSRRLIVEFIPQLFNKMLFELSLRTLEEKLPANFLRIHRRYIINIDEIVEVQKYLYGQYLFVLDQEQQLQLISGWSYQLTLKGMLIF